MTDKTTASDKLVASIRKTKSASTTDAVPETNATATPAPKTAKKAVTKKAASTVSKKAAPKKKKVVTSSQKKALISTFQSGRRVWPD